MSILPQIHRTSNLGRRAEHTGLRGLQGNFMQMELTRVKGSDIAQCSAIPSFVIVGMPERGGNKALFYGKVTAKVPQVFS